MIFELRHPESSAALLAFRQSGDLNGKGTDILLITHAEAVSREVDGRSVAAGFPVIRRTKGDRTFLNERGMGLCKDRQRDSRRVCLAGVFYVSLPGFTLRQHRSHTVYIHSD